MSLWRLFWPRFAGDPGDPHVVPVTDAGYDWDSYVEYGRQRFLTAPLMKWMFEQYVSDPAQRGSDLMSPVRASAERLRGLPPTLIAVAENDILRDEGEKMGRWLDEAGVEVTTVRFNGVIHDWGMLNGFAGLHPTRTLVRLAGAVLRDYLRNSGSRRERRTGGNGLNRVGRTAGNGWRG